MMTQSLEQLEWLAARYVLGELDAEETASFEERLGCDEAAACAVVAAVRLTEAIAVARPAHASDGVLLVNRGTAERGRGGYQWSMLATAVCLAIAAVPLVAGRRPVAISEPAEIVWRWKGMPLEHVVGSGLQVSLESPPAERLPPWLVAAVAIAAEGADVR